MSINSVNLSGNLTRNPEFRTAASGKGVLKFGIGVNDRFFNQQTQKWEDKPCYVECVLFGNRANSLSDKLHKGSKVVLSGKLNFSSWQDQEGKNRSKLEVIVNEIDFVGTNQNASNAPQQRTMTPYPQNQQMAPQIQPQPVQQPIPQPVQQTVRQVTMQQAPQQSFYDEDIPF